MVEERMTTLVTGVAGFIGFHIASSLLNSGYEVIGIDNLNSYYSVSLKKSRLSKIISYPNFTFYQKDIKDFDSLKDIFSKHKIDRICNLAAQAGVRYSLEDPFVYQESNIKGFLNLLEIARDFPVNNFVYASSSSVYGNNKNLPFSVEDNVDNPISLYAATKRCNELIAYSYSHLFNIPLTGLRYFTVYGPWGRPDMVMFLFTNSILKGQPINVYNFGNMKRDFTYIDDVVNATISSLNNPFKYEIFNVASSKTIEVMELIKVIEKYLGRKAEKVFLPIQLGDVPETYADISKTKELLRYEPKISIYKGVKHFVEWYQKYKMDESSFN